MRKKVIRRHAGKVHEPVELAAAGFAPRAARKADPGKARRRELVGGFGAGRSMHEKMRECRKARVMSDDQQRFHGGRDSFKKRQEIIDIGAVEQIFDRAGGFSRELLQHDLKRIMCAACR